MQSEHIRAEGPNAAQIEYWNAEAGNTWVRNQQLLDGMLDGISDVALARAGVQSGERVLDVGCGCGATALALARLGARVTGMDISEPMLELARSRAAESSLELEFRLADAELLADESQYDLVFSRFGVMFFADPTEAFTNLFKAMKPGARMNFVCWQAPQLNPWMSAPMAAALSEMPPMERPDPRAPGPFAFAEAEYVTAVLAAPGFKKILLEPLELPIQLAPDIDEAFHFFLQLSPLGRLLQEADLDTQARISSRVRQIFAAHLTSEGIRMDAACWLVSASKPA